MLSESILLAVLFLLLPFGIEKLIDRQQLNPLEYWWPAGVGLVMGISQAIYSGYVSASDCGDFAMLPVLYAFVRSACASAAVTLAAIKSDFFQRPFDTLFSTLSPVSCTVAFFNAQLAVVLTLITYFNTHDEALCITTEDMKREEEYKQKIKVVKS